MRLLATIGLKFLQLREVDEAVKYLSQAAEADPSNLPLRIQLFDIAYQQRDDEAMRKAQGKILELVGSDRRRQLCLDGSQAASHRLQRR